MRSCLIFLSQSKPAHIVQAFCFISKSPDLPINNQGLAESFCSYFKIRVRKRYFALTVKAISLAKSTSDSAKDLERFFIPGRGGLVVTAGLSDAGEAADAIRHAENLSNPAIDWERLFIPGRGGFVVRAGISDSRSADAR